MNSWPENNLSAYMETGFANISGWLHKDALEATFTLGNLQRDFGFTGPVCEIGVWQGRYLVPLTFLAETPQRAIGIDPFVHVPDRAAQISRMQANITKYARRPDLVSILERDSRFMTADEVLVAGGSPFQFVSVDGDHSMEGTLSDLRLAEKILHATGIVALDDINNMGCPGVVEAAIRYGLEPDACLAPFLNVGNKLFLARREMCTPFRDKFLEQCGSKPAGTWQARIAGYRARMAALGVPVMFMGQELLVPAGT